MHIRRLLAAFLLLLLVPLGAWAQGFAGDFGDLEARLRLDPAQKVQFDASVAATRRAMLAAGLVALDMKARLAQELAKPSPDLERLLADPDAILSQVRPQWREAREEWARFYGMLDARQLAIAREAIERRLALLEDMGGTLLRGWGGKMRP